MAAALVVAAEGVYLADVGTHAPWTGMLRAAAACGLLAIGFVGRSPTAVPLGIAALALPWAGAVTIWAGEDEPGPPSDDPDIGDGDGVLVAVAIAIVVVATALVLLGWGLRLVRERLRSRPTA